MRNQLFITLLLMAMLSMSAGAMTFNEAPMLAEKVASGELPPVEDRLPDDPFVVGPGVLIVEEDLDWEVGTYGGTLQTANPQPDWQPDLFIMANEPLLLAPGISAEGVMPNIVSEFSSNEDNTVFEFTLRTGLKWSDGEPVSTEDVRFVFEDVYGNPEITPVFPAKFRSGGDPTGEPGVVEILDEHSFRITFGEPYGAFITQVTIAGWAGYQELLLPAHHLKQYHINYVDVADLKPELEAEELSEDEWYNLFNLVRIGHWDILAARAAGFPSLNPWVTVEAPAGILAMERNPYYHKVDVEGNQLPYIDRLESFEVSDVDMSTMMVITGEIDILREDTALNQMPLYRENEERGGYRTVPLEMHVHPTYLAINYTYDDPTFRLVTNDLRFRQAVNYAIDRDELIDSIYFGLATEPTWIPSEYDLDRANELLDEMGMDQRDSEGWRLAPNGETFDILIEVAQMAPDFVPVAELMTEYLQDIGINASMRQIGIELRGQRDQANELQATIGWTHGPIWPWGNFDYLPSWGWGRNWIDYFNTGGTTGETFEGEWIDELFEVHRRLIRVIPDSEEGQQAAQDLRDFYYENIPLFLTAEEVTYPMIFSAQLGNVPHSGQAIAANYSGEQLFFREE